jgi:hypothetical protein
LISQLAKSRSEVPEALSHLHARYSDVHQSPSIDSLASVLSSMLPLFNDNDVFIVVDALDECDCDDRLKLLSFIRAALMWSDCNFHLLLTSRREAEIELCLSGRVTTVLDLGQFINSDIACYLQHVLDDEDRFSLLMKEDKRMVKETLVAGADGMYV